MGRRRRRRRRRLHFRRSFVVLSFFELLDSFPKGSCAHLCGGRGPPSSISLLHFPPPSLLPPPPPPVHLGLAYSTLASFLAPFSPSLGLSIGFLTDLEEMRGRAGEAFLSRSVHPSPQPPPQPLLSLPPGPRTLLALSTAAAATAATVCPLPPPRRARMSVRPSACPSSRSLRIRGSSPTPLHCFDAYFRSSHCPRWTPKRVDDRLSCRAKATSSSSSDSFGQVEF